MMGGDIMKLNIIDIFMIIIGILTGIPLIGGFIYAKTGLLKKIYHDKFGWHEPADHSIYYTGILRHAVCKYCNEEIMQDSQGNWF